MISIRKASDRGHADHGWLNTFHTFSFADYYDPTHMGFRALRVINDDRVQPGQGFGTHPHRDMEIITYVLEGALQHRDSMGTGSIIRPGEVQRMSAGTGVTHSEFNASRNEVLHLLQIWLLPTEQGITPSYEQKSFESHTMEGRLRLVASPDGRDESVTIHTDAKIYAGRFDEGVCGNLKIDEVRHVWVHLARGRARINGIDLAAGDGAALSSEACVRIEGVGGGGKESNSTDAAELLIFDLA